MHLFIATLCDQATESSGKLFILGSFDTIRTQSFPMVHKECTLALRMTFDHDEIGKHKIEIKMLDEDGRLGSTVMNLDFEVKIPDYLLQVGQNFSVNIESLRLAKPGNYTWVVNYDRQRVTAIPLRALLLSDTPT